METEAEAIRLKHLIWNFLVAFAGTLAAILVLSGFTRPIIKMISNRITKLLMTEPYQHNMMEMITATVRMSPIIVMENSYRAETGGVIKRPFGSPRKHLNFDGLMFIPAQLSKLPAEDIAKIDTKVTIGPRAAKPLTLDIPILMGAVGYGVAVSEKFKIAMAKGAAAMGTATNVGEGAFLPEERAVAKHLIIQYPKSKWNKAPHILKQADAVEIHLAQGATVSMPVSIAAAEVAGRARELLGLAPGEDGYTPSRHQEMNRPEDLRNIVQNLRKLTQGVPIGVKMAASHKIEEDLEIAIYSGVDFISLDGSNAGTRGGPPILEDDFGLPSVYGVSRAAKFLRDKGVKDQVTLLAGGGFFTPGDCLKAIALGADAVYMGTAPIWAMTHTQVTKTMPFEPPLNLIMYNGPQSEELDEEEAAYYLRNFLKSFTEEIKTAVLAMGKTAVRDVDASDLVALDEWTSKVTGVPLAFQPHSP